MTIRRIRAGSLALAAIAVTVGWTAFHLELNGSYPEADAVMSEAPTEIWLHFSVEPDMKRSSFSVRGPEGNVELGEVSAGEDPEVMRANVTGAMPGGDYTLSWVGAPLDDHVVRGRFSFSIEAGR